MVCESSVFSTMLIVHIFKNPLIRECSSLPHTLFEDTLFKTSEDIVYPCRRHLVYITTLKMTVTKSVKTQHIGIFLIIHNNSQVHALAITFRVIALQSSSNKKMDLHKSIGRINYMQNDCNLQMQ